jgi:hypothetical protein
MLQNLVMGVALWGEMVKREKSRIVAQHGRFIVQNSDDDAWRFVIHTPSHWLRLSSTPT